ncbi:MAG TPA: sporulation transcription factor Spo0A [Clostridia bacterium]|nr:sporulation transcription factor Spo0A [Clostridia bacterium]
MKHKIGLVCNAELEEPILRSPDCEIVYNVDSGVEAFQMQEKIKADIVVTELLTPKLDGYLLIEQLKTTANPPRIIVVSELKGEVFLSKAYQMGINQYIVKPVVSSHLLNCIVTPSKLGKVGQTRSIENSRTLDERITNIFISVGIPAHIKGYQYLRQGIKLAVDTPTIINSITKTLYPAIAEHFLTTPSKVERAIRHAIEVAWNRGKIENINSIFGIRVYSNSDKPTNGEFIALIADKMLLECAY